MKIKKITSQHRRDFRAIYECEHCEHEKEDSGYDDDNFHRNIIPDMKCSSCGKTADEDYRPLPTRYPEGAIIFGFLTGRYLIKKALEWAAVRRFWK